MPNVSLAKILEVYDNEISKHVKHQKKLEKFERHKMEHITNIYSRLKCGDFAPSKYHIFLIYEPKCRIIMSLDMEDKIINHYFTRYHLITKFEHYLDVRNVATRKGMGTDYGLKLTKKYLEEMKKYPNVYALKIDISKYFYSIDHEILKSMLKDKLEDYEYAYVESIINSTDEPYINEEIERFKRDGLPRYINGKGLGIGNMSSQFLSVFYLSFLDHYIVHDLHLKRMVHYMDDYIIFHEDKQYLKECLEKIKSKLNNEFKLNCNPKKTFIVNLKHGFAFLGYYFKLDGKKTRVKLKADSKRRVRKNLRKYQNKLKQKNFEYFFSAINNYYYTYKYHQGNEIKQSIETFFKV